MFAYENATGHEMLLQSTAADLMTVNPLSFDEHTPIQKAWALLRHHDLEAAPVVDDGIPTGELTQAACAAWDDFSRRSSPASAFVGDRDWHPISEIVSPIITIVRDDTPSQQVVRALVRGAGRVYVVDDAGCLVGVVTMSDVLRRLVVDEL